MSKIKSIEKMKANLKIGQIKCSDVWAVDGQEKLKGNTLKAFERDLETICSFSKSKIGRSTYYQIEEIFEVAKEKFHGNKVAMVGNTNKANKLTYVQGSDSEFIAAIIINRLEYLERNKDVSFKTLGDWLRVLGMGTGNKNVKIHLKQQIERNLIRLSNMGLINLEVKFNAMIEGDFKEISEDEYNEYNEKSKAIFRKVVGDIKADVYMNFYNFCNKYNGDDKEELIKDYRILMNTNKRFTFKTYKVTLIENIKRTEHPVYLRLSKVLYNHKINIQRAITNFVRGLEDRNK